ncbi:hypothetical protein TrCOL_g11893 [Triparma columacea]|uniref:Uncharacterized protein n=1 Tax=Triparma columacea TaxID=722753 RepID=A0A9W7GE75_9STRA|nr:hypothetical protein TrCOL_g11893 [Triparma columacea]
MNSPIRHRDQRNFQNKVSVPVPGVTAVLTSPSNAAGQPSTHWPLTRERTVTFPDRSNDQETGRVALDLADIHALTVESQEKLTGLLLDLDKGLHLHNHTLTEDRLSATRFVHDIQGQENRIAEREQVLGGMLGNLEDVLKC